MTPTTPGPIWDEASGPQALDLARRHRSRWDDSDPARRPDLRASLPEDGPEARPGLLLALLRVDLALRREAGEAVAPEWYLGRHPGLDEDVLVALVYEEFCLREEDGERPDPAEYRARYPGLAGRLGEILEIHELVAAGSATASHDPIGPISAVSFPEAGETIAGFLLVEELGRGSFARVFLARERQLADRPVALKVSRAGSREPRTLARLQHTHIVPVHSYRTDPATGLHLLCMPYLGRATLATLLSDPATGGARSGADLVSALDRAGEDDGVAPGRRAPREELARRSYPRAIAWWGARMAEALRHAHDRGVLHRDVKPSNILIAGDGTPMLLDFNLAREPDGDPSLASDPANKLGGTLAYMAPEHLEAVLAGHDEGIDHRADIYAMGMVLSEMLGSRPSRSPSRATTLPDAPTRLREFLGRAPRPFAGGPGRVPPALLGVIRRCLAPDPADRYRSAGDLALDLQAVADDAPLAFAREPIRPRTARWLRRNLVALAVAAPIVMGTIALASARSRARVDLGRREAESRALIRDAIRTAEAGEFPAAAAQFALAADRAGADLAEIRDEANGRRRLAEASRDAMDRASTFSEAADPLRFALLGFVGDRAEASRGLIEALRPLGVLTFDRWADAPEWKLLGAARRARLFREVDDLLFFWVVAASPAPGGPESGTARAYCDLALKFSEDRGPWVALRLWLETGSVGAGPGLPGPGSPVPLGSGFRWYLLGKLGPDRGRALGWLERSARLEPGDYWLHFALGWERASGGELDRASAEYQSAVALRPGLPWAWKNRALIRARVEDWSGAVADLDSALAACRSPSDAARVRVERGRIRQRLGDFRSARRDLRAAIDADPAGGVARDARRDLARLEADSGAPARARELYDDLIASDPGDRLARWGRARLALRRGEPASALDDLDLLVAAEPGSVAIRSDRAWVLLFLGRPSEAAADASASYLARPSASSARIRDRAMLASGAELDPWPTDPAAFDASPIDGPALRADLRSAAGRSTGARRAVLLSAARDHAAARAEADRVVAAEPRSAGARLLRARVLRRAGRPEEALRDVEEGLRLEPESPDLAELRGSIRSEAGDPAGGLADLAVAAARGSATARGPEMARALSALGRHAAAAEIWSQLVDSDPDDPRARLGLALSRIQLGEWDRALASLEVASASAGSGSPLLGRITIAYAACLPARPDRLPRVVTLARRFLAGRVSFGDR